VRGNADGFWLFFRGKLGRESEADSVVDADGWVWVTDGAAVVGDKVWDTLVSELHALHFAELVLSFFRCDAVDGETTLDVVKETEVFARLFDGDDIHEASRVGGVGADLSVNLDEALGHNQSDFTAGQSILEPVADEDGKRKRFSELVGTS